MANSLLHNKQTFFWLKFNKEKRQKLVQGIKDGFALQVST